MSEISVYGILTLENVIERILQVDILDERDRDMVMRKMSRMNSDIANRNPT